MQAWWWRSVAVCTVAAAVAGSVAVTAVALDGDRAHRAEQATVVADRTVTTSPAAVRAPTPRPAPQEPRPDPARAVDATTGASVLVSTGWRRVPGQRLLPVPADRFPVVLAPNDRAAVLVGSLDPARVGTPVDPARLGAETRRLVAAFATGASPDAARVTTLSDAADTLDGHPAWTVLRRADGGPRPLDGTLVRVTTLAGAPRGVVALAVVRPGPTQVADARAAEAVVRSLDLAGPGAALESGGPGGRPAEPARPAARTAAPRPTAAPPTGPRPTAPARPATPVRPARPGDPLIRPPAPTGR